MTAAIAATFAASGCASDEHHHRAHHEESASDTVAASPEMEGSAEFFSGQLGVEILLNRGGFAGRDAAAGGEHGSHGGSFGGGHGGRHGHRGGGGESAPSGDSGEGPAPHIVAANMPPVRLHLRLTNRTDRQVDVSITDFDSELGNFVVQPAKFTLAAHVVTEAEPMISRLGVDSPEVPITVGIHLDAAKETQSVVLHFITPAAAAAPAAPSGPPPATPPPSPAGV